MAHNPTVALKEARERREEAKKFLSNGIDPSEKRKEAKAVAVALEKEQATTFEFVAREWHSKKTAHLSEDYRRQILGRLERMLFPYIGNKTFATLEPADILFAVRHAEKRGAIETAHRLTQLSGQICRYAVIVGYAKYNAAAGLSEALPAIKTRHLPAITDPKKIGHLLRAIDSYQGDISILYALRMFPYVFIRSSEIRGAEWAEFDLKNAE